MGNLVDVRTSLASIPHIDQILAGALHGPHRLIPGNHIASNWELYRPRGRRLLLYRTPPTTMPTKVLTYNLFRGHESLGNKTPGERAKVSPPFREWADVVKAGAASRPATKETRPSQSSRKSPPPKAAPKAKLPVEKGDGAKGWTKTRRRIKTPRPVYPKMSPEPKKPTRPPRWARLVPRLPGRN